MAKSLFYKLKLFNLAENVFIIIILKNFIRDNFYPDCTSSILVRLVLKTDRCKMRRLNRAYMKK